MGQVIQNNFRVRKHFGRIQKIIDIPNLIDIQKQSYDKFLQKDISAGRARGRRAAGGLQERLPDQGLHRDRLARVRQLQPRASPSTTWTSAGSAA